MPDTQHTPGPWRPNGNTVEIANGMALRVATCTPIGTGYASKGREESRANARLIAAAPDLLEELKNCISLLESLRGSEANEDGMIDHQISEARAAISKAAAT